MEWNAGAAVVAGLAGTAVMTMILYMGIAMMPRQMTMNILSMEGSMMTRSIGAAYVMGAMMQLGMGIVFAIIHTSLYGVSSWKRDSPDGVSCSVGCTGLSSAWRLE